MSKALVHFFADAPLLHRFMDGAMGVPWLRAESEVEQMQALIVFLKQNTRV